MGMLIHRFGLGKHAQAVFEQRITQPSNELLLELHKELDTSTFRLSEVLGWDVSDWVALPTRHAAHCNLKSMNAK